MAIAEYNEVDGLSLYFGCQQEEHGQGGAGLLRMLPHTGASVLFPLTENNRKIYAGGMFLAERCDLLVAAAPAVKLSHMSFIVAILVCFY